MMRVVISRSIKFGVRLGKELGEIRAFYLSECGIDVEEGGDA